MDNNKRRFIITLVIVNVAFAAAVVLLLRHSVETAPLASTLPSPTVTTPTPAPPTPSPSIVPATPTAVSSPSPTIEATPVFQYQIYSDPASSFTTFYPSSWQLAQVTHVSSSELQVKFGGLVNDNPASRADVFIGYYPGAQYADWYKTIASLTNNYSLESKDLRNGDLTYSTFFKNVQSGFCRTYVSEVSGGAAVLECTYPKDILSPAEEQLLDSAMKFITATMNKPAATISPN